MCKKSYEQEVFKQTRKIRFVETFFEKWTEEMAYILGYFAADGCMYENKRGSKYVGFTSTDRDLLDRIKETLKISNKIEGYDFSHRKWKKRFTIQIGSRSIFENFIRVGFMPHKSKTLKFPLVPEDLLCHFIRGYFDGDGCVCLVRYLKKDHRKMSETISTRFISGSKDFLLVLHKKMSKILTGGSLMRHGEGAFVLAFSKMDSRLLYKFMYPYKGVLCLERKHRIFESFFGPVA